ncbi:MAG TPA: signal peptidase I [Steroidobacteraceae bacterium]|nr:signal peptidase I [Steroidobacteraceae bacterium]
MLTQLISILAWMALPALLIAIIDDWFLRPQRRLRGRSGPQAAAAGGATPAAAGPLSDPPLIAVVYYILPVLLVAGVLRLLISEQLDFSLVLVIVVALSGLIWLADHLLFAPARRRAAERARPDLTAAPAAVMVPVTVDYARSFFPVALIVLLIRAFVFEPFRIPSDSMMPTLLDGDFIIVNKYDYGLRLPVLDRKIVPIGEPHRGDVVVFRFPPDPSVNYIKRLVGLPGDHVRVFNDQLIINGKPVPLVLDRRYDDGCYHNMRLSTEVLGRHTHQVLSCLTPYEIVAPVTPTCHRRMDRNYVCVEPDMGEADHGDSPEMIVPPGEYLMIGDNRDNSYDGRYWGFVPEANLVGKATYVWFNWDLERSGGPTWSRIGHRIQ